MKHRNKHLDCGCCGSYFITWDGYRDQDQDAGFGICRQCQVDAAWDDHSLLTGMIDQVAGALKEASRTEYLAMDRPLQEAIVYKMLDKGYLKWTIGGRA